MYTRQGIEEAHTIVTLATESKGQLPLYSYPPAISNIVRIINCILHTYVRLSNYKSFMLFCGSQAPVHTHTYVHT